MLGNNSRSVDIFAAEWVFYKGAEEKAMAVAYLGMWKHFFLKKNFGMEPDGEEIIDRPNLKDDGTGSLAVKLVFKGKDDG